jgi:3-hydroxyisobutyrate dehydrogenase
MLQHAAAIDEVLDRGSNAFERHAAGRILVNMGTVSPAYSAELARDVEAAGGHYIECPVSGSRGVAQTGDLVALAAGDETSMAAIEPLLRLMTAHVFHCGAIPSALRTKLAVNLFLITLVTGLAEGVNFARGLGIKAGLFRDIIGAGPMASPVALVKLDKLLASDLTPQAAIRDVLFNCDLIHAEAQRLLIGTPMLDVCRDLLKNAVDMGEDNQDMIGVIAAISRRTARG